MMSSNLMAELEIKAKKSPQRIAFPESGNEMILKAAEEIYKRQIGYPMIVGNERIVRDFAAGIGVSVEGFTFYDHNDEDLRMSLAKEYAVKYSDLSEKSVIRKLKDSMNMAMMLLKLGKADGVAAGREYTTADVIIAAQAFIGLKDGFSSISSLGILDAPGFEGPEGNMLAIADCAVNAQPDAMDLADIAIASAETVRNILGWEPRVAMLSFSTCGSSEHETIDVIREGIKLAKERCPELKIDGEFQLDTAIIPRTAAIKVKRESEVAGRANVLIFPNLHAGNIGVKLIQIFGKANAYGPVLQGFSKPICDFSRNAPLAEMMGNIIMLIIRAQAEKGGTHES